MMNKFDKARIAVLRMHADRVGERGGPLNDLEIVLYDMIRVVELRECATQGGSEIRSRGVMQKGRFVFWRRGRRR